MQWALLRRLFTSGKVSVQSSLGWDWGGLPGVPGPEGWAGVVSMKRHAQVRRATYTYGVIPQDVQLLHQLCDQDVLGGR